MFGANKLLVVLVASSGVRSSGQFLRPMVTKSFTSSWMSSSSWVPGRDGQMHQNMHEVNSQTFHDHGMPVKHTESETACRDGLCQQTVSIERPGSITVMTQQAQSPSRSMRMLTRLHSMLRGLSFPMVYVEQREAPVNVKFLAPRTKPVPTPVTAMAPGVEDITGPAIIAPLAALAGAGASLAALIVAALVKRQHSSSRELPLQTLGEPLAPSEEARSVVQRMASRSAVAAPAMPKEAEIPADPLPVGAYLDRVYARAASMAEAAAAKQYMYRVYERAAA